MNLTRCCRASIAVSRCGAGRRVARRPSSRPSQSAGSLAYSWAKDQVRIRSAGRPNLPHTREILVESLPDGKSGNCPGIKHHIHLMTHLPKESQTPVGETGKRFRCLYHPTPSTLFRCRLTIVGRMSLSKDSPTCQMPFP